MSSPPSQSAATTAGGAAGAAPAPASPSHGKICFNAHCKEQIAEGSSPRRRGWRLRSGELAELCARCASTYEQGGFCDTFHSDGDGWRKCESCGKRVHCGCIVSVDTFMLLDAGGVECIACARKNFITVRISQLNASGPVPGQWRQASNMWKTFTQSDLQQRLSYEFDRPNGADRLISGPRLPIPSHSKKKVEDLPDKLSSHINRVQLNGHINVNNSFGSPPVFSDLHREERCVVGLHDPSHLVEETDTVARREVGISNTFSAPAGISFGPLSNSNVNTSIPTIVKDETSVHLVGLVSSPPSDSNNAGRISSAHSLRQTHASHLVKQSFHNAHSGVDSSGEAQTQVRNVRSRVEGRCRNQLLPRYWPRITDQELQQISGDSNSVVTPLFEKMLSASDAGRIGRLVLPKKCAEAYFPAISQPEGLPLKVQDANGQEWVFQFRFWPNNNSRMYVLEGVTPCIQSMKLQAGDTVTFSRMDPEGKLVMGFRKASNVSNEQDIQAIKGGNGYPTTKEVTHRNGRSGEGISALHSRTLKGNSGSKNACSKVDKSAFIQNERTPSKSYVLPPKRKGTAPGSKNKRLRIENEDSIELKLTWEEAQELLHPPPNHKPSIVVIEGHEFEEYEEAPVLGKPAAFATNEAGHCSSASKITISGNSKGKGESDGGGGAAAEGSSEGLDTLANLAILGEGGESLPSSSSSQQPTTRHPRHRPGCTCIVCIQPPSGKGPKHKPSCQCNVCLTVKRRFRTLMLRKEKRQQSEKDGADNKPDPPTAAAAQKAPEPQAAPPPPPPPPPPPESVQAHPQKEEEEEDQAGRRKAAVPSPIKTQIDLNIQPDREEEPSPVSDAGNLMRLLQDAAA
ncbi:unnamed protein product [Spirodela intermedia]|uniref:TF-B3 domain-containing protein n=1 Tax=Spirodela intermedia TaxID=51605 RepID=A0A7I8KAI8_SPIIN|nr:unnamed protein product [Spirodela intermedia]